MPVDVEVVIRVLDDPAQRRELGEHGVGRPEGVEQLEAPNRVRAGDQAPELGELALAGGLRGAGGLGASEPEGRRVDLEAELGGEPGRAQDSQWVVGEAELGDRAQDAGLDRLDAPGRVDRHAARVGGGDRDRVGREVALGEVVLDRLAAHPGDVDVPATVARERPPGSELGRELERRPTGGRGDLPCEVARVAGDREVDVDDRAAEDRVANSAADDPRAVVGFERVRRGANRGRGLERAGAGHASGPESTYRRGTRAEIPQVTS